MQAARVNILDQDNSFSAPNVLTGINGVSGVLERGPFGDPSIVFNSPEQFRRIHGGLVAGSDFAYLCLRHLGQGGKLRINRVGHYTDPTDPTTLTATKAGEVTINQTAGDPGVTSPLWKATPKYSGAAYNQLKHEVTNATNGNPNFFNLRIYLADDVNYSLEVYENLTIVGKPNIANSTYLDRVIRESKLLNFSYQDLSAIASATIRPNRVITPFVGGTNGGVVLPADYIGDEAAGTGLYSFDPFDDMALLAVPDIHEPLVSNAGILYADARKDLEFIAHLDYNLNTVEGIISERAEITADSKYGAIFGGGLKVKDATTQQIKTFSEIMDVMTIANFVDENFGPWYSLANFNRGQIKDALGPAVNFGSAGNYDKLNQLAGNQINMIINRDGRTQLSGNFTAQLTESKASFLNVTRLLIYLRKLLRPILNKYLEEPTDIETFRAIYREVLPILESLKARRAVYNFLWQGDQDIARIEDVQVNTLDDLDQGKYKIKLGLEPIAGLQEINLIISLNRTGELSIELDLDTAA